MRKRAVPVARTSPTSWPRGGREKSVDLGDAARPPVAALGGFSPSLRKDSQPHPRGPCAGPAWPDPLAAFPLFLRVSVQARDLRPLRLLSYNHAVPKIRVFHVGLGPIGSAIAQQVYRRPGLTIVGAVDPASSIVDRDLGDVLHLDEDIDRAIDAPLAPPEFLDDRSRDVSLRVNQRIVDVSGAGEIAPGDDPLRIGNTALLAFSPLGGATSGTLYVAAHRGPQMAIRVFGGTGRVRVLMFDAQARQWRH